MRISPYFFLHATKRLGTRLPIAGIVITMWPILASAAHNLLSWAKRKQCSSHCQAQSLSGKFLSLLAHTQAQCVASYSSSFSFCRFLQLLLFELPL